MRNAFCLHLVLQRCSQNTSRHKKKQSTSHKTSAQASSRWFWGHKRDIALQRLGTYERVHLCVYYACVCICSSSAMYLLCVCTCHFSALKAIHFPALKAKPPTSQEARKALQHQVGPRRKKNQKGEKQRTEFAWSSFAWHLRHMEDRPFHVAWYLQNFAYGTCNIFELQISILHGGFHGFPFCLISEELWNLNLLTRSFTSWSLHQRRKKNAAPRPQGTHRQLPFAVVVFFFLLLFLLFLPLLLHFVVLFAPFVFAALLFVQLVAALHVVLAKIVIKQNSKEASRKKQQRQNK